MSSQNTPLLIICHQKVMFDVIMLYVNLRHLVVSDLYDLEIRNYVGS